MAEEIVEQPVKEPDVSKAVSALGADLSSKKGIQKAIQQKEQEYKGLTEKKAGEIKPVIEAVGKQKAPESPTLEPVKEYKASKIDPEKEKEAFSSMMAWSMIGGALTKQPLLAAMKNYTGAMQGWMEGDKQRLTKEKDEFDRNFKVAQAKNTAKLEEYKSAQTKYGNDVQGLMNQLKLISLKYEDPIKASLAEKGDLQKFYQSVVADERAQANATNQMNLLVKRLEMQQEKPTIMTGKNGTLYKVTAEGATEIPNTKGLGLTAKGQGPSSATKGGAINGRLAYTISENFGQSTADLLNVAAMPTDTVLGSLAGMTGKSGDKLTAALRNNLAREMTADDARMMQQVVAGLEAGMSRTLGGGYASSSTKAIMDQYTKQIPQAGDSPIVTATFLARIKQELGIVAENFASHPGASEAQVEQVRNYMKTIDQVIPFTVKDVINVQREDRGTVSQQSANLINIPTKSPLPSAPVPQEATTGALSPEEKAELAALKAKHGR